MPIPSIKLVLILVPVLLAPGLILGQEITEKEKLEFFESKVRPILYENCFECHSDKKQEGGLRADRIAHLIKGGDTGPAILPGKPDESELVLAIRYDADGYQMPPKGKLDQEQIDILTRWVKEGAFWPDSEKTQEDQENDKEFNLEERAKHWSFQPVKSVSLPEVKSKDWPLTPVDHFILSKLEQDQLSPAPETDKLTLLRRITFDLTGLPPSVKEINQFLEDNSPDAYENVIERLLSSPHYGERWARHWLDLVRYSETLGHEFDFTIYHAQPYRDYVIRAFNNDVSYQQFAQEHIAGDLLEHPRINQELGILESPIGTGFYWFGQGKHSPVDIIAEEADLIDNQIDVLSKTFLGLTVSCARCHDHKFDPITTKDYYALSGFLQSSRKHYTFIDLPEKRSEIKKELKQLKQEFLEKSFEGIITSLESHFSDFDQFLLHPSENISSHPERKQWQAVVKAHSEKADDLFHVWTKLKEFQESQKFNEEKIKLIEELDKISSQPVHSRTFENFLKGNTSDWLIHGDAFESGAGLENEIILAESSSKTFPLERLVRKDVMNSGIISGRLEGISQSKTFKIEKPYIFYRVLRSGGKDSPGKQYNNGQVSLIIDGFEIIRAPIYGSLAINTPADEKYHWHVQDVSKWVGHKAYIEISDGDDGYLSVDQILFGDKHPEIMPNQLIVNLLKDPELNTIKKLAEGYKELIQETFSTWKEDPRSLNNDQVDLVNVLLKLASTGTFEKEQYWDSELLIRYRKLNQAISSPLKAVGISDGTPEDQYVFVRGNPGKKGQLAPRSFLEVFEGNSEPHKLDGSGRLELARKITSDENPLFARVLVNRLWHHHFGRGIVETTDDFGKMGKAPTHPELLDYLADQFIKKNWSIKEMHRMMVLSRAYRMSSDLTDQVAEQKDPDNLLLHRFSVQRLEAEAIRDSVLSVSGELNPKMYGPSVPPFLTPFMAGRGKPSSSGPLDGNGRRSIYINVRRNFLTPMFLAFDYPTPFTTIGKRSVSNVPAQGLIMMNNEFVIQQAQKWAERILAEDKHSTENRIRNIYLKAFCREPSESEMEFAEEFLENSGDDPQRWADFCHVIFNVKEFVYIY